MQVFNCYCFYQFYNNVNNDKNDKNDNKNDKDIFIGAGMERYLCVYKNKLEDLVAEFHSPD